MLCNPKETRPGFGCLLSFFIFFFRRGVGGTYRGFVDPYPLALTVLKLRQ